MPDWAYLLDVLSILDPEAFARRRLAFTPDTRQAQVLKETIDRGILNCSRQWGKSTTLAVKAAHRAYAYPDTLTIIVSPSERQSAELLRKIKTFLRKLGIKPRGDGDNAVSVLLPNGSRVIGLPGNEDTIRGFSAVSLVLIDEAARVPDELYQAVRPMLAVTTPGQPSGQLWLLSTPNGPQGFFYEEWAGRSLDGDPWTRITAPATECSRIAPAFLAQERTALGEERFRQEYLCEFLQGEQCFLTIEDLKKCLDPNVKPLFPSGRFGNRGY